MKFKFVQIVAAALVIAGCAKEQALTEEVLSGSASENTAAVSETQTSLEPVTIWENGSLVAFRPDIEGMGTKLTVGADGTVSFTGGEAVLVTVSDTQGTASSPVKYAYDSSDQVFKVAEGFTPIRVLDGYTANIYYPYDCFSIVSGTAKYTMPSYNGTITNLGEKNPMAAKAQLGNATITMLNLASLIRIDLLGNENDINSGVKLSTLALSTSSAALKNGSEWSVDWTGTRPVFEANAGDETSRTVTCTFDGGVTLDADEATSFYFIAPYSDGASLENLTVTATNSDGNTYSRTRTSALSLSSSTIVHMGFRAGLFRAGDGQAEETAYEIATADDFRQMAKRINAESTNGEGSYHHACYKQVEDIDFREGYSETKADLSAYMIGVANNDERFTGTYDGGNKTLSYFSLSNTDSNTGLWSASLNATFKNIKVDNASISGAGYVGTIVANMYGPESYMSDCTVTNTTVTATAENAGGVIGRAYGTVKGCRFGGANSSVSGAKSVGGVIGNLFGNSDATEISNCSNAAPITSTDIYVGGVIGLVTDATATVKGCTNSGNVKGVSGTTYKNLAGGIVGSYFMSDASYTDRVLTIEDCTNEGKIHGNSGVGGIMGGNSTDGVTSKRYTIKIKGNINNTEDITGANTNVGGIIGYTNSATVTIEGTCRNMGNVTGKTNTGGIAGNFNGGSITGATNTGKILASGSGYTNAGGIVGKMFEGSLLEAENNGIVTSSAAAIGLGGIVGCLGDLETSKNATVSKSINNGQVAVATYTSSAVGGIVGQVSAGIVKECRNNAHIGNYPASSSTTGNDTASEKVGGVAGEFLSGVIDKCYSSVSKIIRGGNYVGGVVGYFKTTTVQSGVINCFSRSAVYSTGAGAVLGGIVGYVEAGSENANIMNCSSYGATLQNMNNSNKNANIGGVIGRAATAAGNNNTGGTVNIRNCFTAIHPSNIKVLVGSTQTAINASTITASDYKYVGVVYGQVTGYRVYIRDIHYRSAGNSYQGTHSGQNKSNAYFNCKTGYIDNICKNLTTNTFQIIKTSSAKYSYTGYFYQALTRATYSPTNESNKFGTFTTYDYTPENSDWVKEETTLSGYPLQKDLQDLGYFD